jgi:hypothetical protein
MRPPGAFPAEHGIEIIKDRCTAGETLVVIMRIGADTGDQQLDPGRLLTTELAVLEVDVVDDFGDRRQRRIIETGSGKGAPQQRSPSWVNSASNISKRNSPGSGV